MTPLCFSVTAKQPYRHPEAPFVDVQGEEWAQSLLAHYDDIREELFRYVATSQMQPYFHQGMVSRRNSWKTLGLKFWGMEWTTHHRSFPLTCQWMRRHPSVISVSFSKLEANSRILPHCGDTNGIYRVHLGLSIPAGLPACGFRAKEEQRPWKEKELLAFVDAFEHEAWNQTPEDRYVMILDVIRPEYRKRRAYICAQVVASLLLQKMAALLLAAKKTPPAEPASVPFWLRLLAARSVLLPVYLLLPVRNLWIRLRS